MINLVGNEVKHKYGLILKLEVEDDLCLSLCAIKVESIFEYGLIFRSRKDWTNL